MCPGSPSYLKKRHRLLIFSLCFNYSLIIHRFISGSASATLQQEVAKLCISSMAGLLDKAKEFVAEKIAGMDKPTAEVKDGVRIKGVSRKEIKMETTVQIMNPYKHSLPICEVSYKLHSNERIIASGTVPDPGSLKACDTTDVTVPINVPYDFLFSLARDIGADWDIDYRIDLGLTIDLPLLGNFTIPLSHADTLKLPTLKDLF